MTFRVAPLAVLCLLVGISRTAVAQNDGSDSPAAERATFTVADGFDGELFAAEADGVRKPIQIRFDAREISMHQRRIDATILPSYFPVSCRISKARQPFPLACLAQQHAECDARTFTDE